MYWYILLCCISFSYIGILGLWNTKGVEGLGTIYWNGILVHGWFSSIGLLHVWVILHNKKLGFDFDFFSVTDKCRDNLKPRFLIKSGYHIIPSPSTALWNTMLKYVLQCFAITIIAIFTVSEVTLFFSFSNDFKYVLHDYSRGVR